MTQHEVNPAVHEALARSEGAVLTIGVLGDQFQCYGCGRTRGTRKDYAGGLWTGEPTYRFVIHVCNDCVKAASP